MLQTSWDRCWKSLNANGDGYALRELLIAAYREPHRKYHTLQHLFECLILLGQHRNLASEPAEVEAAIWFHDAIYDVTAQDNEAQSADWASRELQRAGVCRECIDRVREHILATRHNVPPQGQDQMLLIDIDLAILGAPRARFEEYEMQIKDEYGWVPEFIYCQKRREVLSGFLARDPIYNTTGMREAFEKQARENLTDYIRQPTDGLFALST